MDTPDTTKSSSSPNSDPNINSTAQASPAQPSILPSAQTSSTSQGLPDSASRIGESSSVMKSSEGINLQSNISPNSSDIKANNTAVEGLSAQPIPEPQNSSSLPSQSVNQASSMPSSDGDGDQPHKVNKFMLPVAVLFLGAVTGVFLYFSGFLKNDTLRLGEYTSNYPSSVPMQQKEKIIVGTDATYPPMESKDENGNLVGYDIDLGEEIGTELGYDVEFKDIAFDKIFDALDTKQIDVIISSVTITDERSQKYNFSEPYINAGQVIVIRRDGKEDAMSAEELKGKRVGVQKGTTSEEEALKYTNRNLVNAFSDYTQAVAALSSRTIDALIVDLTAAKGLVDENPSLVIASDPFTNEFYGVALRKDDVELKSKIDKVILSLQKRGILNNIKQKWFQ